VTERQLEQLCNMFFEVAKIPLTMCRAGGEPLYWVPRADSVDEPAETHRALIGKFTAGSPDHSIPFVEITDPSFFYAVIRVQSGEYLLLGPAAPVQHSDAELRRFSLVRGVPEEKRSSYCERLRDTALFSFRQFLTTTALLNYLFNGILISPEDILLSHSPVPEEVDRSLTHALFSARENQVMHTLASYEHYVLQAITDGNLPKLKQALLSPVSGSVGKMSDDPIQQEKYTFICFITLVTRAAIAGGLNQELAFSLSDIYCQKADRLHDISEITKLSWEMCVEFTERVAALKGRDRLSPGIAKCCEYINMHLHDDIQLSQLAALVRVSPKSLSKRFKQETGASVADYIHRERIKEAQALLEYSDYSISEIGYHLQYASQSYFSTIFKKFSGATPQQFREGLKQTVP